MGRNARKFAEENFNPEKHYERLMKIYRLAMERRERNYSTSQKRFGVDLIFLLYEPKPDEVIYRSVVQKLLRIISN